MNEEQGSRVEARRRIAVALPPRPSGDVEFSLIWAELFVFRHGV
ncbi:hypothetical protein [Thauera sinica]|uniref:Uncharacterized protein n=1 Tax=Thauera sinica TaxID=2665146 RepID=A0ABW1ARD8_9RHOO|nr:hypothetical protein [Thauera sp. K11]